MNTKVKVLIAHELEFNGWKDPEKIVEWIRKQVKVPTTELKWFDFSNGVIYIDTYIDEIVVTNAFKSVSDES